MTEPFVQFNDVEDCIAFIRRPAELTTITAAKHRACRSKYWSSVETRA